MNLLTDDRLTRDLLGHLIAHTGVMTRSHTVIGVAGESGSGKSTTAARLADALIAAGLPTVLINQDNYFVRPPRTNHEARVADLSTVGPHEVQLALIEEHIAAFRQGVPSVVAPLVNYPENRFDTQTLSFHGSRVLIVEGTYVLQLTALDVRIFLEATHRDTHERRMARNRDIHEPIIDTILEIEHAVISAQAAQADVLVDRDFQLRRRP